MREVLVRVAADAREEALDRLLPIAPDGLRCTEPVGGGVHLRLRGRRLPPTETIRRALAGVAHAVDEQTVSDDWRIRRLADYRAEPIAERLVVRPDWAPRAAAGLVDVSLADTGAFGVGTHPTTRMCLEHLLDLAPAESFADLGCGSGVLAIVAARLGAAPVLACDVQAAGVAATARNATANGVEVDVALLDLMDEPAPRADAFAANVPAAVHKAIVAGWANGRAPRDGIISGIGAEEVDEVLATYATAGLSARRSDVIHGWAVCRLARAS